MRTSFAVIAFALASVATSQLANIPSCALDCFVNALTTDGCSGLTDFACHCKKTDLISSVTPCVQAACSAADQAKVITAVEGTCASVGVTITVGTAITTSAPPASSSVVVASSTPGASSTSVASSAPAGYSPAAVTPSATSSTAVTSLAGTGTLTTASSNGTVTTASTPTAFTGAAAQVTQAVGIVAAAALALAAAL